MLGTAWHLLVFGYLSYVRRTRLTMLPTLQDAKDGWQALMYNIGRAQSPPQMGRYTFEEKMEYWAFVWGAIIMGVTGFMMWNPITTARFLPGEVIPAAKAAHGGEALLAVLAIIVWHMYGVHIKSFNRSMFTGKMTEEEMLHEHPLELADIKSGIADRPVDEATLRKRQRLYLPIAGVLALFMLLGVYGFVNAEQTALTTVERQVPTVEVFVSASPSSSAAAVAIRDFSGTCMVVRKARVVSKPALSTGYAPPWVRRTSPCCSSTRRSRRTVSLDTPRSAASPTSTTPARRAMSRIPRRRSSASTPHHLLLLRAWREVLQARNGSGQA